MGYIYLAIGTALSLFLIGGAVIVMGLLDKRGGHGSFSGGKGASTDALMPSEFQNRKQ